MAEGGLLMESRYEPTPYAHVLRDVQQESLIISISPGVVFPLDQLVAEMQILGLTPAEMHFKRPQITEGMTFSGLAYWADHVEFRKRVARRKSLMSRYIYMYDCEVAPI
jgi:hypothetical protein